MSTKNYETETGLSSQGKSALRGTIFCCHKLNVEFQHVESCFSTEKPPYQ
jgi:hypothetical protein